MEFEFSARLDNADCHVRFFHNVHHLCETVNDRPHKHYFMEFHCVFRGEETIDLPLENRQIRLHEGQIILLPGGSYHGVRTENGSVERMCFNFSAEPTGQSVSYIYEQFRKTKAVTIFDNAEANLIAGQCRKLRLQENPPMLHQRLGVQLLNLVLQLFSGLSGAQVVATSREDHALRQKWVVEEYIERHFADQMGLDGLAQELQLSSRQARKLVQQFLGEDYKTVIIRRRMELAEIYLRNPEKSLEEIAWLVGYSSYSGFQLCFKKYFGMTPSQRRFQLTTK